MNVMASATPTPSPTETMAPTPTPEPPAPVVGDSDVVAHLSHISDQVDLLVGVVVIVGLVLVFCGVVALVRNLR